MNLCVVVALSFCLFSSLELPHFSTHYTFHDLWMQRKFNSSIFSLFCVYNGAFVCMVLSLYALHRSLLLLHIALFVHKYMSSDIIIWFVLYSWNLIQLDLSRKMAVHNNIVIIIHVNFMCDSNKDSYSVVSAWMD